jgi:hypothetical protein
MAETALKCVNCGAGVSPDTSTCPACGHSVATPQSASPGNGAGWSPGPAPSSTQPDADDDHLSGPPELGQDVPREVVGLARGVQTRSEQLGESHHETVWTFRVERYDEAGNRELLVPVEMRGLRFEGSIADGDWVRVRGRRRDGTLRASELENLTTGATVRAKGLPTAVKVIAGVVFLIVAIIFVVVVVEIINAERSFSSASGLLSLPVVSR